MSTTAMSTRIAAALRDVVWPRRGVAGWAGWLALQPASALFGMGVLLRNAAYDAGVLRAQRADLAVVSVGNLSVGGTGKTPMTLWLAQQLAAGGIKTGILLRGYGGRAQGTTLVSAGDGPLAEVRDAGDEAVMLARSFKGPVLTAARRIDGARRAAELGCRVIVLDDGFQHRALARDFDLVLLSGREGSLLPSGPMRENRGALRRADALALVSKVGSAGLPAIAVRGVAGKPLFAVRFEARALIEPDGGVWRERPLRELSQRRIAVIAGIADPRPFYLTLRQWEADIGEIFEFPDHHSYTATDWQRLSRATHDFDYVVTTEKDLVKLEHFPFARGKLLALRVSPHVDGGEQLVALIRARIAARLRAPSQEEPHAD
jgi:tetraacyldisaccharide 4'-kinase